MGPLSRAKVTEIVPQWLRGQLKALKPRILRVLEQKRPVFTTTSPPLLSSHDSYWFNTEGLVLRLVPSITSKSMPGRRSVVFDFLSVKER